MAKALFSVGSALRVVLATIVMLALFLIVGIVFYQVITRYFTGTATPELAEIARFLFIWLVFTGSALLISRNELITIDFFSVKFSPSARRLLSIFVDLCIAAFLIALLIFSEKLLEVVAIKRAPATGIAYDLVYAALPTFAATGLFFIIERAVKTRLFSRRPSTSGIR
ncbi:TRAP transporter small permease [Pseudaminobacter sp. 19-2017]|uniref:TRAP transporter small permease protein n=1 Tax=Pseudaminobacter soli (ex Zhang et al. 2022) TaxID=2831468 RepID=A0A942EBU1_9HYPH|nr:TRAP transporter small permease [Pseudaminobacter soli]MBS3652242.1 TRAP transporter small permease [Pseudaminobacter soli]